jgi:hypothetical protein
MGYYALVGLLTGDGNVAFGDNAAAWTTGAASYNTALGWGSLLGKSLLADRVTGSYNTGVGYYAGRYIQGASANNLFLGANAGPTAYVAISNRGYIDNAADDSPLIGMDFSGRKVGIETAFASMNKTFTVTGDAEITGGITHTPSAAQVIDAVGDAILANAGMVVLNPDGDYTLTSTPTIADGTAGQIVYVTCANAEANTVTVQDQDTLASSNLQLGGVSRAISGKDVLVLLFNSVDWIEVSFANN